MVKLFIFCSLLMIHISSYALESIELKKFISNYNVSNEKALNWSKAIYAIENDLDEIALFFIKKEGVGGPNYDSRSLYFNGKDKTPLYSKNILITCVRKNKINILNSILNCKYPPNIHAEEYWIVWDDIFRKNTVKIKEKKILNISIEESSNSLEIVKILVNSGIELNKPEHYATEPKYDLRPLYVYSRTPLEAAIMSKKFDVAKYLVESGANSNGIIGYAIKYGDLDLIEFFLLKGASPSGALQAAIDNNNKEAVIMSLNFGADPVHLLDYAVQKGNQEIIDILIDVTLANSD